jgi:hypothetical protein
VRWSTPWRFCCCGGATRNLHRGARCAPHERGRGARRWLAASAEGEAALGLPKLLFWLGARTFWRRMSRLPLVGTRGVDLQSPLRQGQLNNSAKLSARQPCLIPSREGHRPNRGDKSQRTTSIFRSGTAAQFVSRGVGLPHLALAPPQGPKDRWLPSRSRIQTAQARKLPSIRDGKPKRTNPRSALRPSPPDSPQVEASDRHLSGRMVARK